MSLQSSLFHTIIIAFFVVVQSVFLNRIEALPAIPDIALIILVFSAYKQGKLKGQLTGLVSGTLIDFLSLAPLGFHALLRTVIGYLFGAVKGKLFVDPVLVPVIMVIVATLLKNILANILAGVFIPTIQYTFLSGMILWEIGLNVFLSPFILGILQFLKIIAINEKDSY